MRESLGGMIANIVLEEYLVSHGKNGGFGRFACCRAVVAPPRERVVVRTARGWRSARSE